MGIRKYADVEEVKILPVKDQEKIASDLKKLGKTSASNLTSEERRKMFDS